MSKVKALAKFLGVSEKQAQKLIQDEDYLVLTDDEADKKAEEEIRQSLWAFNADFIGEHCKNTEKMDSYEYDDFIESLKTIQSQQAERTNGLVLALIDDIDEFIDDAIDADGRGHFISRYDGDENEQDGYFIYRQN